MRGLVVLLLLAGCPKQGVVTASTPEPVRVGSVEQSATDGPIDAGDTVMPALVELVEARNLRPEPRTVEGPRRTRLDRMAEGSDDGLVLLVESTARFSSQMIGRYRWTVEVEALLADSGDLNDVAEARFSVPVHLIYAHQGEKDAIAEALPGITRRVGNLMDDWIREHSP